MAHVTCIGVIILIFQLLFEVALSENENTIGNIQCTIRKNIANGKRKKIPCRIKYPQYLILTLISPPITPPYGKKVSLSHQTRHETRDIEELNVSSIISASSTLSPESFRLGKLGQRGPDFISKEDMHNLTGRLQGLLLFDEVN